MQGEKSLKFDYLNHCETVQEVETFAGNLMKYAKAEWPNPSSAMAFHIPFLFCHDTTMIPSTSDSW